MKMHAAISNRLSPSKPSPVALAIHGLHKQYGKVHVVKGLDLDIESGELMVLLGPSGCGKSTVLRMIAGLEAPDAGKILLGGQDITDVLPKYRDIAMVFQSYALYPHKTVAKNIGFPLKVRGITGAKADAAVREAARQVELEHLLDRFPKQLSGGQRQRVALARAIVRRPSVFLMDEPLSNLDAKLRGYMRAELKRMQYELGTTTIYVTHDQVEAMTLAHRVAILSDGVIQQLGKPREIYNNPANLFVAGFLGSPPMNFFPGELNSGYFTAPGVSLAVSGAGASASGGVVLGFRPEDATLAEAHSGHFDGKVYASELIGDYTLLTVDTAGRHLTVKMPKEYEASYDSLVGVSFPPRAAFLFDKETGQRLSLKLANQPTKTVTAS
jgi:multiple sugar transport system ATP-binding protein